MPCLAKILTDWSYAMDNLEQELLKGREYVGLAGIEGPLIFMKKTHAIGYGELVQVVDKEGHIRLGNVLDTSNEVVIIQLFEDTTGLDMVNTKVSFMGESLMLDVSENMLGRIFNGIGKVIDGGVDIVGNKRVSVNGSAINPYSRFYPNSFIQTGISVIDGMNTLIRGQKLPIFSGNGLPHNELAAQIARQAKITNQNGETEEFCIVFAALGVKHDTAEYFINSFQKTGTLSNVALFLSLADDPSVERIITPRCALTLAEHLAFECDKHVLVIMTDMSNYCESLREISTLRSEIPSRKGYPGYLYSDLAEIYERAGMIKGKKGSITQLPILTMPNDDISHPIPDLTGYITEGQIVFDRDLASKNTYPPFNTLASLSRLAKDGIGEGFTRKDHPRLSNQLFASYSHVKEVRNLASIIGEDELSEIDKIYIKFGDKFEKEFIGQGIQTNRSITQTLDLGWKLLSILPKEELTRVSNEEIEEFYIDEY